MQSSSTRINHQCDFQPQCNQVQLESIINVIFLEVRWGLFCFGDGAVFLVWLGCQAFLLCLVFGMCVLCTGVRCSQDFCILWVFCCVVLSVVNLVQPHIYDTDFCISFS